jgi:hypothetical protein
MRFCSAKCRYAARDRARHLARGTLCSTTCASCGGDFEYRSTTKPRKYCLTCSPVAERPGEKAVVAGVYDTPTVSGLSRFSRDW